jgi:hypothetical protein
MKICRAESALCARAPVDILAVDRLADGDGRGRCGALGGGGSVDVASGVPYVLNRPPILGHCYHEMRSQLWLAPKISSNQGSLADLIGWMLDRA